ncbi:Rho-binding antiterminator [Psychrosphaera sp. F3M07]|uniref:Rho-binding antiterminator n=1 Tax=Psychrosphaera sp. F3M07 TaxID=2841560 RepID=UPI001C0A223B|nr:Rho-binding antiterminator [Psychrosphaera sp. F3M07]MBU2919481.1 Rho-binding antiterminator [Psychrosphaera sp. F3M07]
MISCNEYDYVEIVCMYRYPVNITLKTGLIIEGIALDTQYNAERKECIKVDIDDKETLITLASIAMLEVGIENPHFKQIFFT